MQIKLGTVMLKILIDCIIAHGLNDENQSILFSVMRERAVNMSLKQAAVEGFMKLLLSGNVEGRAHEFIASLILLYFEKQEHSTITDPLTGKTLTKSKYPI